MLLSDHKKNKRNLIKMERNKLVPTQIKKPPPDVYANPLGLGLCIGISTEVVV